MAFLFEALTKAGASPQCPKVNIGESYHRLQSCEDLYRNPSVPSQGPPCGELLSNHGFAKVELSPAFLTRRPLHSTVGGSGISLSLQ